MRLGYIKLNLVIVVNRDIKYIYRSIIMKTMQMFLYSQMNHSTWNLSKICSVVASGI